MFTKIIFISFVLVDYSLLAIVLIYSTYVMLIVIIQMSSSLILYSFLFFNMELILYFRFILFHAYAFFIFLDHSFTSNLILATKVLYLLFHFIFSKFSVILPLDLKSSFGLSYRFQTFSFD
jgi:hypothetical protein